LTLGVGGSWQQILEGRTAIPAMDDARQLRLLNDEASKPVSPGVGLKADRISRPDADKLLKDIYYALEHVGIPKSAVHVGGSYRRGKDSIGDLDIALDDPKVDKSLYIKLVAAFKEQGFDVRTTRPHPKEPNRLVNIPMGDEQLSLVLDGRTVEFKKVKPGNLGSMLIHITGSGDFNKGMRVYAMAKGMAFSQAGLRDRESGMLLAGTTEEEIFKALGVPFVPPKDRTTWPYPVPPQPRQGDFAGAPTQVQVPPEIMTRIPPSVRAELLNYKLPATDEAGKTIPRDFLWNKMARQRFYKMGGRFAIPDRLKLDRYPA